tara:strand:+ start:2428 stop:3207 length:780 start_codon:yes stop_codon:yes gene_type:complete
MKKFNKNKSLERCKKYRKNILKVSQNVPALHIGGAFSCTETLEVIYNYFLNTLEKNLFILSKGHASILQYVILEDKKIIKKKELELYCKKYGSLGVHAEITTKGINASTGSLGHGPAMAAGFALVEKKSKVFVVISDGELQEGSTWEAIMLIPALKLSNVVLVVDNNNLQSLEKTSSSHPNLYPIDKKFKSFGWDSEVCDGHNSSEIFKKIKNKNKNKPYALIAKTIKGYPISFMKHKPIWHYKSPNKDEFKIAMEELK